MLQMNYQIPAAEAITSDSTPQQMLINSLPPYLPIPNARNNPNEFAG